MNNRHPTYTMALIAVVLLVLTDRTTLAEPPPVEYVRGEPLPKTVDRAIRDLATVIAVFDTMPHPITTNMRGLGQDAARESIGEIPIPTDLYDYLDGGGRYQYLINHTRVPGSADEPPRDRWTVLGVDDAMVKALSKKLIELLSAERDKRVVDAQQKLVEDRQRLHTRQGEAREKRRTYDEAFRAADDRGVAALDHDAVKAASLELRSSLSATLADVAELQARLKTAIAQELQQRAVLREAGKDANKSPLIRKITEMRTDLEIELAGKLGRRKALEEELTRLSEGNRYLEIIQKSVTDKTERYLHGLEIGIEEDARQLLALESTGPFRVVGGKIVISPIAEPNTPTFSEP